jgi:hypothetical protein
MTTSLIIPERLAALDTISLDKGSHTEFDDGHCAMEDWDLMRASARSSAAAMGFWTRVDATLDSCWPWEGRTDAKGYGRVGILGLTNLGAHRVSWALTHGCDLPTQWVLHRCDNPPCVRPSHLFLGDATDNNRDRQAKGRTRGWAGRSGAAHHRFAVTAAMADDMRALRASGATQQAIADRFGISRGHVARIVSGVLPRHAKGGK